MKKIKYYKDIIEKLKPKWKNKEILRACLTGDEFQHRISISSLTKNDIYSSFEEVNSWIEEIEINSKNGYKIEYRELQGVGKYPRYALINSVQDAILLLNKSKEVKKFKENSEKLLLKFPELLDYIYDNCFKIAELKEIDKIISVLLWFKENKNRNFYIRELDIEGVDTKFIEGNSGILKELLSVILKDETIEQNKDFAKMFGFKVKPDIVRMRILDPEKYILNFSDISVPIDEFASWDNDFSRIFIVENEINFLSFPLLKNSLVIFGAGYGAGALKKVNWLKEREVYYWGDLDTHGFGILSNVRKYIENTKSFLMTEEILLAHRDMWVEEDTQASSEGRYLTPEEANLLHKLKTDVYGKSVRLEQERIRYSFLKEYLKQIG